MKMLSKLLSLALLTLLGLARAQDTVVDIIVNDPDLSVLLSLVQSVPGLAGFLSGPGPFT